MDITERVRLEYLELCKRLEELFSRLNYEDNWQVIESLASLDGESDIDWEYGWRQEVIGVFGRTERDWVKAERPTPALNPKDVELVNRITLVIKSYHEYKKSSDKKFETIAEKLAKDYNQKYPGPQAATQTTTTVPSPPSAHPATITTPNSPKATSFFDKIKPDEINFGIPGVATATYDLRKSEKDEKD
jgi:hypothetical protein